MVPDTRSGRDRISPLIPTGGQPTRPRNYPQPYEFPVEPCGQVNGNLRTLRTVFYAHLWKRRRSAASREISPPSPKDGPGDPLPKTAVTPLGPSSLPPSVSFLREQRPHRIGAWDSAASPA